MAEIVFLYVTHPDASAARALGLSLVESEVAACVNIIAGMSAVYRWQGGIEEAEEAVMIVKTRADLETAARTAILRAHPYVCPCVVTMSVAGGDPAYLDWVAGSCRPA